MKMSIFCFKVYIFYRKYDYQNHTFIYNLFEIRRHQFIYNYTLRLLNCLKPFQEVGQSSVSAIRFLLPSTLPFYRNYTSLFSIDIHIVATSIVDVP